MPYLLSVIIVVSAAFVIFFTRFEVDETSLIKDLQQMETMFLAVDSYANTYIEIGESLGSLNFKVLEDSGILLSNASVTISGSDAFSAVLTFPNNNIRWHILPNIEDGSSYKIFIDISASSLMSKVQFVESFIGREYCQSMLFGSYHVNASIYIQESSPDARDWTFDSTGDNTDGLFLCIIYK